MPNTIRKVSYVHVTAASKPSGLPASRLAACGSSSRVRARDIPCMHGTMVIAYRHAV